MQGIKATGAAAHVKMSVVATLPATEVRRDGTVMLPARERPQMPVWPSPPRTDTAGFATVAENAPGWWLRVVASVAGRAPPAFMADTCHAFATLRSLESVPLAPPAAAAPGSGAGESFVCMDCSGTSHGLVSNPVLAPPRPGVERRAGRAMDSRARSSAASTSSFWYWIQLLTTDCILPANRLHCLHLQVPQESCKECCKQLSPMIVCRQCCVTEGQVGSLWHSTDTA